MASRAHILGAAFAFLGLTCSGLAQAPLYDIGSVREIHLQFQEEDWSDLLDTLYLAGDDARLIGDLWIDGTHLPDVGVRYKGYSSYSPSRVKNPFNIKLDHVHPDQNYQGFEKLKLSNVIQDPSFLRETLSYEVARKYMPASRANYANVYVNDVLIGLYTNVEDVNKEFVDLHFGSRGNAFFKCNPATVDLSGENSNLSDSPGSDPEDYFPLYSMESDEGWEELLELIDVLNNDPSAIEELLNVDRALWMHAFNYALINFDSYVGYAQNYYLYKDDAERWNTIPWDLNMSFASFRLTDASLHWNGFSIAQAMTMDPLLHHSSVSVLPRPLMRNLFLNGMYRRMYLAHLRTIIEENFASMEYYARAEAMRAVIADHVVADTNKFYSDQDFLDNLDVTVVDLVDYPGIAELMDQRTAYLQSYPGYSGAPVIADVEHAPNTITVGGEITITATISGADTAFIAFRSREGDLFAHAAMRDDGIHDNGVVGDGVYGCTLTTLTNLLEFYIYAENDSAGAFSPQRAAYEYHTIMTRIAPGDLVINELMAFNEGYVVDEHGGADDWVELYNAAPYTISTSGLHLSDDPASPTKWELPAVTLAPGAYLIVWADEEVDQGDLHAALRLDASGESLLLAYDDTTIIDRVDYGVQYPISTYGRYPNGTGAFHKMFPTFNAANSLSEVEDLERHVLVYPNPTRSRLYLIVNAPGPLTVSAFGSDGRQIIAPRTYASNELITIDAIGLSPGRYTLSVSSAIGVSYQPFILIE